MFATQPLVVKSFTVNVPVDYRGVVLTCFVVGITTPTVGWYKITNDVREIKNSNNSNTTNLGLKFASAELIFQDGFRSSDAGSYVCLSQQPDRNSSQNSAFKLEPGASQGSAVVKLCSINNSTITAFFQIRVLNTDCKRWDTRLNQLVVLRLYESLLSVLSLKCQGCFVTAENVILAENPVCSEQVAGAAVFRGTISNLGVQTATRDIFCTLYDWQQTAPTVLINDSLHFVDQECELMRISPNAPECPGPAEGGSNVIAAAVGSTTGSAVFIAVVAGTVLLVIVITLTVRKTRNKSRR